MEWVEIFSKEEQPSDQQIADFIKNPLWEQLNTYLQEAYQSTPKKIFSGCSMQAGWNIKYQKSGKSLCTLYPMDGYFIALVVIGKKEMAAAEELLPLLSKYTQNVFEQAKIGNDQKWLMLNIKNSAALEDAKALITLRVAPKQIKLAANYACAFNQFVKKVSCSGV